MIVPLTLGDFLERAELVYGAREAVVDEPNPPGGGLGRFTYAELAERARSLAAALDDLGVGENDRVAIVSPNAARFLIALFGVSVFGRVLVPVNFRLNAEEIRYIIEHSGSSVLLVDPELDEALRDIPVKHRFVLGTATDPQLFLKKDAVPRFQVTDENATVSINYTSGTTARPKGVQLTHRNFWLNAVTFGWHLAMTDRDVYLHTLPTFHCNGWGMPYAVTGMGVRQVVIRKIDGEEILRRVDAEGVTLFNCAPAVIAAVLDAASARRAKGVTVPGRGRVRVVIAGAPPPSKTIERIETELGWEFIQIYGLTETAPLLTINRAPAEWDGLDPVERARRLSRAGVPAVGVRMRVDAEGEVLARANHVFEGYWNQPAETAKAIQDGWFHTGDGGLCRGRVHRHHGSKEGRHHHGRRERLVHRGGGLPVPASRGGRGRGDRRARREVGRDHQGPRRAAPGRRLHRARAGRALPEPHGALQVSDVDRAARCPRPHGHGQAPEVQAARPLLVGPRAPRQLIPAPRGVVCSRACRASRSGDSGETVDLR